MSTSPTTGTSSRRGQAHLTLLAETNEGYANLIRLSSLGDHEGHYKPRVDWELPQRREPRLVQRRSGSAEAA
jgi:DNA polymerase III subunit alpha